MTEPSLRDAPSTQGRHSGPQDPREDGAALVSLRASSLDQVWCPREGWIDTPPPGRHGHPSIRYCPEHPQTAVERHWGPCPRCWVNKVYRETYEAPAPVCGACRGILRPFGSVAALAAPKQDQRAAVA